MKHTLYTILIALSVSAFGPAGRAAEPSAAEPSAAAKELNQLVGKVRTDLQAGKKTEADFADDLKEFDALLAKHKDEKTDDVASILLMKGKLYEQVFKQDAKATEIYQQVQHDFPDTKVAKMLTRQEEAKKAQAALVEGAKFPDFSEKDVEGKPLSVSNYKGKVVLVDFWATWCPPCVAELPNVIRTYEKYHDKGFEVIGISLDESKERLTSYTKEKKMPWQQYFDGLKWENKLAGKYGIQSIPATFLLDGEGKIIGKDLRGEALEAAVSKALGKN